VNKVSGKTKEIVAASVDHCMFQRNVNGLLGLFFC